MMRESNKSAQHDIKKYPPINIYASYFFSVTATSSFIIAENKMTSSFIQSTFDQLLFVVNTLCKNKQTCSLMRDTS